MKVKVIKSEHTRIIPGMIGEAVAKSLNEFEVTFELKRDSVFNRPMIAQQVTVWMTRNQIEDSSD